MNYFLILLLLVVSGGGFYIYVEDEQKVLTYDQEISDMQAKFDKLQADSKQTINQLTGDKALLAGQLAAAQARIATLTQVTPKAGNDAGNPDPNASPDTIATLDGKVYQNVQVLRVDNYGITFTHSLGTSTVGFTLLPPDLQKKYGYKAPDASTPVTGN